CAIMARMRAAARSVSFSTCGLGLGVLMGLLIKGAIRARLALDPNIGCLPRESEMSARAAPAKASEIAKDFNGRVAPRQPRHPPTGVRPSTAQIEPGERHAVTGMAQHRPGAVELVERQLAVENIAIDEAEPPLQVERREHLAGDDARPQIGRVPVDRGDY